MLCVAMSIAHNAAIINAVSIKLNPLVLSDSEISHASLAFTVLKYVCADRSCRQSAVILSIAHLDMTYHIGDIKENNHGA